MADVKFIRCTEQEYKELPSKDSGSFYLTEGSLYLGDWELTSEDDISNILFQITSQGIEILSIKDQIGDLNSLKTSVKDTLINAINEIYENGGGAFKLYTEKGQATDGAMTQKAVTDELNKNVTGVTYSGRTVTVTKADGSSTTFDTIDTNTTYSNFKGATSSSAGSEGLVPAPTANNASQFLKGDGTWASALTVDVVLDKGDNYILQFS